MRIGSRDRISPQQDAMYPNRSSFISGVPRSAWWTEARPDVAPDATITEDIVETQGLTFIGLLERQMWAMSPLMVSYDQQPLGVRVSRVMDGRWTDLTSRAVWAYAREFDAPRPLLDAMQAEAQRRIVGPASLKLAIWLMRGHNEFLLGRRGPSFDAIRLPGDVVPPMWGEAPPIPYSTRPPLVIRPNDPLAGLVAGR